MTESRVFPSDVRVGDMIEGYESEGAVTSIAAGTLSYVFDMSYGEQLEIMKIERVTVIRSN